MLRTNQINRKNITNTKKKISIINKFSFKKKNLIYVLLLVTFSYLSTTNEKFYALLLMWILKFLSVYPMNIDPLKNKLIAKLIFIMYQLTSKITILLGIGVMLFLAISRGDTGILNIPMVSTDINILITILLYTIHRLCIGFCILPFIAHQIIFLRNQNSLRLGFFSKISKRIFTIPWKTLIRPRKRLNFSPYLALIFYSAFGSFLKHQHLNSLIPASSMYFYSTKSGFIIDVRKIVHYIDTFGYLRQTYFKSLNIGVVNIFSNKLIFTFKGIKLLKKIVPEELGKISFISDLY
jgi:hypothetical protein